METDRRRVREGGREEESQFLAAACERRAGKETLEAGRESERVGNSRSSSE
jgi:hypothetical protein